MLFQRFLYQKALKSKKIEAKFSKKTCFWETAYFDQLLECTAPKCWLKYTTDILVEIDVFPGVNQLLRVNYYLGVAPVTILGYN